KKIASGWLGNFTGDSRILTYHTGNTFRIVFPGAPAVMVDTQMANNTGGRKAFRESSGEREVPFAAWQRYVTASDWPAFTCPYYYNFATRKQTVPADPGAAHASGPRRAVYTLFDAFRARLTFARMSVADAVQMKGLGFSL